MKKQIQKAIEIIQDNKIILYPTDTVWGIGCDATSSSAVQKVYELKKRTETKALIVLVSSLAMLQRYVIVPEKIIEILEKSNSPTTIIYNNPKGLAKNLINQKDNTVAIRMVQDCFCKQLVEQFGKPIVSTSANLSGRPTPQSFSEIEPAILNGVDYVVHLQTQKISTKPSTILKIDGEQIIVIRA